MNKLVLLVLRQQKAVLELRIRDAEAIKSGQDAPMSQRDFLIGKIEGLRSAMTDLDEVIKAIGEAA